MIRPSTAAGLAVTATALSLVVLAPPAAGHAPTPSASPATPTPSGPARPTIIARGDIAFLRGDPWRPSAPLEVAVDNRGATAAKAWFVLRLPSGVDHVSGGNCATLAGSPQTWLCGGGELPAGGSRTDKLTIRSITGEPVWGVDAWGSVAGRDAAGVTDKPYDFRINWPDRTSLRLRATAGPVVDGTTTVRVRVTNTGTFDIGGYSLNITTPDGVRVTAPACSDSGRMNGVGCEILRTSWLKDGATDSFDVRLAVAGGTRNVRLYLAPTSRYTNKDTSVTLRLTTAAGAGAGATSTPSPTSTTPDGAAELPRTGPASTGYALAGAVMVALGAGLLLLRRRLSRS